MKRVVVTEAVGLAAILAILVAVPVALGSSAPSPAWLVLVAIGWIVVRAVIVMYLRRRTSEPWLAKHW